MRSVLFSWLGIAGFLFVLQPPALAAPALPRLDSQIDVAVVVEGSLPGFREDELTAFVSEQMAAAHVAAWHFEPATAPASPNRVVWRFKRLPYAGGSVRYIGPVLNRAKDMFGVRRAIGVDARLYLNGEFQSTTFDQATIKGGPRDPDLGAVVTRVTKSIIANALDEDAPQVKARFYAAATRQALDVRT